MKQLYGKSFVTIYGAEPSWLWIEQAAELTDEQVRAGLKRLAKQKREYPANLTEFVEACKPALGSPRFLGVPIDPETLRIERKANREHVDACLARMRKKLKK